MTAKKTKPTAAALLKAIATERENLGRVIALLQCLKIALENGEDFHSGPNYYDVAQLAIELVDKSVDAFDPSNLSRAAP